MQSATTNRIFATVTGDDEPRDRYEPANLTRHVAALSMTKLADGLIDPKLVLTWLLTALGTPAAVAGLLVPVREAGALLPQIFVAGWVNGMARRKWAWILGSAVQGGAAALILLSALTLSGVAAGVAIVSALGLLAIARSVCSVSYKDILAKTVGKTHRGTTTGLAASVSAGGVILFAGLLLSGVAEKQLVVLIALGLAAALWGLAAVVFSTLHEDASEHRTQQTLRERLSSYRDSLAGDPDLRRFIFARGLLTGSALAPPYIVMLGSDGSGLANLGALVLASALASLLSSYVWGRAADRSSRWVLVACGAIAALAMSAATMLSWAGWAHSTLTLPVVLFVLMIAYHGVRQGRSTYLVDMAPEDRRADYAALSNTAIGLLLLVSGGLGALSSLLGPGTTLLVFAGLCLLGSVTALGLREVQGKDT